MTFEKLTPMTPIITGHDGANCCEKNLTLVLFGLWNLNGLHRQKSFLLALSLISFPYNGMLCI